MNKFRQALKIILLLLCGIIILLIIRKLFHWHLNALSYYTVTADIAYLDIHVKPGNYTDRTAPPAVTSPAQYGSQLNCSSSPWLGSPRSIQATGDQDWSDITCVSLLRATEPSGPAYSRAKQFMDNNPRKIRNDADFITLTTDCKYFIRNGGYEMEPLNDEEKNFPIAYNILVHRHVEQFEYLLRAIYRPQNVYCVHVDRKQPIEFHMAIQSIVKCFENVYISSRLEHIVYAGYSRLQADINCMIDQMKHRIQWKYLINIAAESFPIKTNYEIVQILKIYNGASDIEVLFDRVITSRFRNTVNEVWRLQFGHLEKTLERTSSLNPRPPHNITVVRGSAYAIFSRNFVDFIVNDEKAKALLHWSRTTETPDEHYWATLYYTAVNPQLNFSYGYNGDFKDKKTWLAVWVSWAGENICHGLWTRGYCVFGVGDLPNIISRKELFCNKLYMDYESLALECLYNWIKHKERCPTNLDLQYYKSLSFVFRDTQV